MDTSRRVTALSTAGWVVRSGTESVDDGDDTG